MYTTTGSDKNILYLLTIVENIDKVQLDAEPYMISKQINSCPLL